MTSRWAESAGRMAARQDARAEELAAAVRAFVLPRGDERAIDVGTGAGALALALAPLVREVVGVDPSPELLALARERAPENATFAEADGARLPFEDGAFDLACTIRTLHHVPHPEMLIAELTRVARPGGHVLVIDQIAPVDPLEAIAVDRFERARDPGHTRLLPDIDLRQLFEANGLTLLRDRHETERRPLDAYLELAGCTGAARERALELAPEGRETYTATLGWYFLSR